MVVISVTDEPASLVGPWIAKNNVTHPVVCLPDGKLEQVIGVKAFPTAAVFLGMELQWTGSAGGAGSALSTAQKAGRKDSLYPKALSKVIKSMNDGDAVKALKLLRAGMPKYKEGDADWAKRLDTFLLEKSVTDVAAGTAAIESGFWHNGVELMMPYLGKDSLFPVAEEAQATLDKLETEELFAKEIQGGKLYLEAKKLEEEQEYTDAVKVYSTIIKKCDDAKIAGHARTAGQALIDARRPGYKSSCEKCQKGKGTACEKHHEDVKL